MKKLMPFELHNNKPAFRFIYKMKALYLIVALVAVNKMAFPQTYSEQSVMYARTGIGGTARSAGSAGAYGSVGADLGCIEINPAGLGLYRSTDFSVTPGLKAISNQADYDNSTTNTTGTKLYLSQIGIAWTKILKKSSGNGLSFSQPQLRSITFAINYQNQNFYYRSQNFGAYNNSSSMIDNYISYINYIGQPLSSNSYPVEIAMANQLNLLTYNSATNTYYSNVRAPLTQNGNIETRGSMSKIDLALGGNINDKVYFGFDVGIPLLSSNTTTNFGEASAYPNGTDSLTGFQSYNVASQLTESGVGVTGSVGLIYRPFKWMRLGASYHLPGWYSISENYSSGMIAYFDTLQGPSVSGSYPSFRYNLRTPMKGVASASFYLGEHGFFSVDYEFQNLGSSRFNFGQGNEQGTAIINSNTDTLYRFSHTIHLGFEAAIKVLRLRVGYGFSSSPFKKDMAPQGYNAAVQNATAGIGVRLKRFYTDFAYVFGYTKDASYPFLTDQVGNTYLTNTFLLTLGWKLNSSEGGNARKRQSNYTPPPVDNEQRY